MGQFLHFEQDFFAHRQMTGYLDLNTWLPYRPFFGHFFDGHVPDYVASRPDLANLMVQDSYNFIVLYVQDRYGKSLVPEMKTDALSSLVTALSGAYHRDDTKIGDFPTQTEANSALAGALSQIGSSEVLVPNLPSYAYALPYDKPDTPLSEVERHLGAY